MPKKKIKTKKVTVQKSVKSKSPLSIKEKLSNIQMELKAPKGQFNNFGKYKYRSCEDILEALKPVLKNNRAIVVLKDSLILKGQRYYIKATTQLIDLDSNDVITVTAYAREEESKKGMDGSQITGSSSSYSRKYALNGLFGIDDSKDSDQTNKGENNVKSEKLLTEVDMKNIAKFLQEINNVKDNEDLEAVGLRIKTGIKLEKFNKDQINVLKEAWTGMSQKLAFKK
jgi:hypothetical protein